LSIAIDGILGMGKRALTFIRDGCVERRKIERPHRLGAEHEWIVPHAFTVDLRLDRKLARLRLASGFFSIPPSRRCTVARLREFSSARRSVRMPPEPPS
jgi:hypothetical protein